MRAVQTGNLEMVKLLVDYGAYLFTENNEKRTALYIASANKQETIEKFLESIAKRRSHS